MREPSTARPVTSTATVTDREKDIVCPTCRKACKYGPSNPARPFCSERCRNADFGAWATESYRIAKTADESDPDSIHQDIDPDIDL